MRQSNRLQPVPANEPASLFDDLEFSIDSLPYVPPGEYDVIVLSCRKLRKFDRDVLLFLFQIVSPGPGFNVLIPTYVNKPLGRTIPARAKLGSWMRLVQAYDPALSLRRLSVKLFEQYQFKATIDTVTKDRNRRELPAHDRFSKIANLTAVIGKRA